MNYKIVCLSLMFTLPVAYAAVKDPLEGYEEVTITTILSAPDPLPEINADKRDLAEQGQYLVELLGCGSCHTDGALIGEPVMDRRLAGSHIGIAYSNPMYEPRPGIVFPGNLTPDRKTGLGNWSDEEIIRVIRSGVDRVGRQHLGVMPWPAYTRISDDDVLAIVVYLRSLPPVEHRVPENVKPGEETTAPYVHFGAYRKTR